MIQLSEPQRLFARSEATYPAFVGGYGSGKTSAAVIRALALKSQCIGSDVAYYMPTYDMVRLTAVPRFEHLLEEFKVRARVYKDPPARIDCQDYKGQILFRTMDTPERIIGYEVAHSLVDELDTLPTAKAKDVWHKIIARNRQKCGMQNSVGVVTTPEGFRFVYEYWQKAPKPGYRLYRARTLDNVANLPVNYIQELRSSYPSSLCAAYLDGEFVNLTAGSVYHEFDRHLNASSEHVVDLPKPEPLHIGMDFNVAHSAAVVFVLRGDEPHAVEELTEVFDTPAMVALIKKRYPGHPILIYPDPTGRNREANNASVSDLSLLRAAGFQVLAFSSSPAVKDRILSVNAMINVDGKRRLRVNPQGCPNFVEALEKQAYDKNGEPDKSSGLDHVVDAAGYFITYRYPIRSRAMMRVQLGGL